MTCKFTLLLQTRRLERLLFVRKDNSSWLQKSFRVNIFDWSTAIVNYPYCLNDGRFRNFSLLIKKRYTRTNYVTKCIVMMDYFIRQYILFISMTSSASPFPSFLNLTIFSPSRPSRVQQHILLHYIIYHRILITLFFSVMLSYVKTYRCWIFSVHLIASIVLKKCLQMIIVFYQKKQ